MPLHEIESEVLYNKQLAPLKWVYRVFAILGIIASVVCIITAGLDERKSGNNSAYIVLVLLMIVIIFLALLLLGHTFKSNMYKIENYFAVEGDYIYKRYVEKTRTNVAHWYTYIKADSDEYYEVDNIDLFKIADHNMRFRILVNKYDEFKNRHLPIGEIKCKFARFVEESSRFSKG